jgi:hypothetical protein
MAKDEQLHIPAERRTVPTMIFTMHIEKFPSAKRFCLDARQLAIRLLGTKKTIPQVPGISGTLLPRLYHKAAELHPEPGFPKARPCQRGPK